MELIGNLLVAVSGIAWTIVYLELIRTGFKSDVGSDLRCRRIVCQQIFYLCSVGCKYYLGLL